MLRSSSSSPSASIPSSTRGRLRWPSACERQRLPGVRDVVPTFRSVAVYFDPLRTDHDRLVAELRRLAGSDGGASTRRDRAHSHSGLLRRASSGRILPTWRGLRMSPRKRSCGCTRPSRIASSCSGLCRALPTWGPSIGGSPRRGGRRRAQRVPSGSVGIAGVQTGIYPIGDAWRLAD